MKQVRSLLNKILILLLVIGAVIAVVYLSSRNAGLREAKGTYHSPTLFAFDTSLEITLQGRTEEQTGADTDAALALVQRIEDETSRFKPQSDVSKINAQAGAGPVKVGSITLELVKRSVRYGSTTGGTFDITVSPVVELWGFYDEEYRVPSAGEISRALGLVDYRKLIVDETAGTVMLAESGMRIDLGGIAKGYAVEAVTDLFRERGVEHALVNFGGAIGAVGGRIDGEDWVIGIKDPRAKGNELMGELRLRDGFVSSSGDYERFFIEDGKRYFHIFDPATGRNPTGVMSVNVVGADSTVADILSTAVVVMGPEKGLDFMKTQTGFQAMLVKSNGDVLSTPGMKSDYLLQVKEKI